MERRSGLIREAGGRVARESGDGATGAPTPLREGVMAGDRKGGRMARTPC